MEAGRTAARPAPGPNSDIEPGAAAKTGSRRQRTDRFEAGHERKRNPSVGSVYLETSHASLIFLAIIKGHIRRNIIVGLTSPEGFQSFS